MIEAAGITKDYPRASGGPVRALDDVSLTAPSGTITGVLGPNGAGKTTLFRILGGLITAAPGARLRILGADAAANPHEARAFTGLVSQCPDVPPRATPLWHLALLGMLRGSPRAEALRRAESMLRQVGLEGELRQPMASLSKGNRQRVALARALAHTPRVLLLDEPTSGLDMAAAAWLRGEIVRRAAFGCAVLLATHNPHEAWQLCDRILIMRRGRVVLEGPRHAICRSGPAALEAAYLKAQELPS